MFNACSQIAPSAADLIGRTPLVALDRFTEGCDGRILAKVEFMNPGFSKKDRIALEIVRRAEADGSLAPGQPVLELTSGNTGTGLCIVCAARGHPFVAVMSRGNSPERAAMMAALGAEVVLVDQLPESQPGQVSGGDLALAEAEAARLTEERGAFRTDQFHHEGNAAAHETGTGPEAWEQAANSGVAIDGFADFVGTGGTFGGVAAFLKAQDERIRCFVVEPDTAAVLAGQEPVGGGAHKIQGGGYMYTGDALPFVEQRRHLVDGFVQVTSEEARACARSLAASEGLFCGFSSGANAAAARKLLEGEMRGKTLLIVLCDSGLKYLSTDLFGSD